MSKDIETNKVNTTKEIIEVDGGKYAIVIETGDGVQNTYATRYGEPWIEKLYTIEGCNMTIAFAYEVQKLREENERLNNEVRELKGIK